MWISDVPPVAPIIVAEASQARSAAMERTIGVCSVIGHASWEPSAENSVSAYGMAKEYFFQREHRKVDFPLSKMTVIQKPQHGVLREEGDGYFYIPDADWVKQQMHGDIRTSYLGKDRAVILVEMGGFKIKMVYFFQVTNGSAEGGIAEKLCGTKGLFWKISQSNDNGLSTLLANANVITTFAPLPNATLGTTTGTGPSAQITLDTNAAGHGWLIDSTPADNTEYLPTSTPNEWVAKEGSDAYGKMDLLTVLLHEYGHALGLDHSPDPHEFMATTLQPGVRHTLSVDQQLMLMNLAGVFVTPDSPSEPYRPTDPGKKGQAQLLSHGDLTQRCRFDAETRSATRYVSPR